MPHTDCLVRKIKLHKLKFTRPRTSKLARRIGKIYIMYSSFSNIQSENWMKLNITKWLPEKNTIFKYNFQNCPICSFVFYKRRKPNLANLLHLYLEINKSYPKFDQHTSALKPQITRIQLELILCRFNWTFSCVSTREIT